MKKFFSLIFSLLAIASLSAQVTTSSVNGRVLDDQKAPLAGATVVAVHTPSGTQYASIANNEGRFVINGMRAGGPYSIEVSYLGMSTLEYKDVYLKLGEPFEIEAVMNSTTAIDAVVVVAERTFNASKTGAAQNFSLQTVESMPTIDRSVYDIVKLTPQATVNKNGGISFAGSNNRYNSFQVDGAIANDSFGLAASGTNGGQTGANPISIDAIEEVQVVIAPFDVRQSGFTGGAINAITKSGTNAVKGSFYTFYNNQNLIGTTPGDVAVRSKYDTQMAQTYGVTVGGPIIKNKLFLFVSGEFYKKSRPNIYTPANGSYNNKKLKAEVFDADGKSLGWYFNEAMANAMIKHYESNYGVANSGETIAEHQIDDQSVNFLARMDWNINRNNRLMVRYQYMDAFSDKYSAGGNTYYFNNSAYKMSDKTNTFVAELNSRINEEMSNELRATGVLVRDNRTVPYAGANMYIKDTYTIDLGTEYSSGANSMNSDTFTLTDNFSIFKGNHNITIGTHNEFFKFNNLFLQYAYGGYTYNTVADFFANKINQFNYRYADPSLTGGETRWAAYTYAAQFGLYVQDEWKPSRNFTLTYGVRGDVPMLLNKPSSNDEYNQTTIATENNQYVGVTPQATILWSPRVGFRYFTDDSHKTLVRGGAGLFTGRVPFVWISNAYNNTGMEAKSVQINSPAAGFPLSSNPYTDIVESGIASAGGKATINTLSKDFKYPQVFRVNVGMDHEFDNGWKVTFDALYSKTLNNVYFKNLALNNTNGAVVYGVNAAAAANNPNQSTPYYTVDKSYSAVIALGNTNKGYTYSLSGQIQKSFDFGLDLMASYTYGHSYSVNDGTSSVAFSNWKYNYSVDTNSDELSYSLFDRPHKLMAMVSYKTPVYMNGLQTTIALTYEATSGQRYCYTLDEDADFNGDGYAGNSLMYIPTQEEVGMMNWADPTDAAKFENFIRKDNYLSSNRGNWSERYAGIAPFEHHFDFHLAQDFYYDKSTGRKLQLTFDILNVSNLLNRNWGIYYSSTYKLNVLNVTAVTPDAAGNYTPTYKFSPNELYVSDFYSRWRCQLGLRMTF